MPPATARMSMLQSKVRQRFCATGRRSRLPRKPPQPRRRPSSVASGAGNPPSRLDGVLRAQPALAEAAKLGSKAQKAGFDWPTWRELLPKVAEETAELEAEAASGDPARHRPSRPNSAICSSPSSISAVIWASTPRWPSANAICASASDFARWSASRRVRSRNFRPRNSNRFGCRPKRKLAQGNAPASASQTTSQVRP